MTSKLKTLYEPAGTSPLEVKLVLEPWKLIIEFPNSHPPYSFTIYCTPEQTNQDLLQDLAMSKLEVLPEAFRNDLVGREIVVAARKLAITNSSWELRSEGMYNPILDVFIGRLSNTSCWITNKKTDSMNMFNCSIVTARDLFNQGHYPEDQGPEWEIYRIK